MQTDHWPYEQGTGMFNLHHISTSLPILERYLSHPNLVFDALKADVTNRYAASRLKLERSGRSIFSLIFTMA